MFLLDDISFSLNKVIFNSRGKSKTNKHAAWRVWLSRLHECRSVHPRTPSITLTVTTTKDTCTRDTIFDVLLMDGSHIVNESPKQRKPILCCCSKLSPVLASRTVHRVCECHILSVNFIGQQQDKSFDVMESFSRLGSAGGTRAKKTVCSRRLFLLPLYNNFGGINHRGGGRTDRILGWVPGEGQDISIPYLGRDGHFIFIALLKISTPSPPANL